MSNWRSEEVRKFSDLVRSAPATSMIGTSISLRVPDAAAICEQLTAFANRIEQDERAVPVAWMTHHDDPMLFTTAEDAAAYCDDDETPIALFTRPPAQAAQVDRVDITNGQVMKPSKWAPPYPDAATDPFNTMQGMNKPAPTAEPVARVDDACVPVAQLSELMRGLELGPASVYLSPRALYCIGRAIASQAKEATQPHSPDAADSGRVCDRVVAGALFDLMGFLTTRDEAITLSGSHEASCAVQALEAFATKRGLSLDEANVGGWQAALAAQPQSAASHVGVPDGYVLVPIEPTQAMLSAAAFATSGVNSGKWNDMAKDAYAAMIAAAPSVTPEGGEGS